MLNPKQCVLYSGGAAGTEQFFGALAEGWGIEEVNYSFEGHQIERKRGVRVLTNGDRIFIDLYVVMKYGVSIDAVAQTLKKTVKYDVEKFTGMVVDTVNVNVLGIRV